ncbi:MAG TPA: protein kinase, partial [Acidobacteriota bacterium]
MKGLQSRSHARGSVESRNDSFNPSVRVLLVEQDPDTISVLSLCLSEIRECTLEVSSSSEEALLRISDCKPDLILLAHGLLGKDSIETINEIHHRYPSIYLIVSLPAIDRDLVNKFMVAGVHDCLYKDENYIPNLMSSVKKALIRIAERDAFDLPALARVERLAMDEHLPDIIFSLDLQGRILHVNRAIGPLLGYDQNDVLNRTLIEYLADDAEQVKFQSYVQQCTEVINFRDTLEFINNLGLEERFEVNCTVMEGEMIYGVLRKERLAGDLEQTESHTIRKEIVLPDQDHDSVERMPPYLGPYRVVTLLGAGAMGRVYEGFDHQLERRVAIKVIVRSRSQQENVERFRQEAKILASISHPNIAHIYYYGEWEGLPFFCLEYLPGGSVENQLRKSGTLSWEVAMSYVFQVALGLKEAWQKGVIHMDVKPSNLMLSENNRLKIVDFGLSRRTHDEGDDDLIVGTPLYVAPEQITGEKIDHRSDIYSLGITFFEMLYGFVPFTGGTVREIFARKLQESLPGRHTLDPSVPGVLYDLITRMTAMDPNQRISDYSSLIAQLIDTRQSLLQLEAEPPVNVMVKGEVVMRGSIYET